MTATRIGLLVAAVVLVGLVVPARPVTVPPAPEQARPFAWNQDSVWGSLESAYRGARAEGCGAVAPSAVQEMARLSATVEALDSPILDPAHPMLDTVESGFMRLGAPVALCPELSAGYVMLSARLRDVVKRRSVRWDMADRASRERLYRLLYGTRAAVEEVLLHHPGRLPALLPGRNEPSAAPAATVEGVEIRSGDILVSRGGYPTSALIARGSDYPGNFSHVGLVHVDATSGAVSVIEAHIESGVAVTTAEGYLRDKKLRIMVLRPRADLPQLQADPLLPHRAAALALERARAGHTPYDFAMDYADPSRLFCSEVASSVYADLGVTLWSGISTISRPGLRRWLASLGVRYFATQEPSDLEYDPQLAVVAEWRDPTALRQDHLDNAVVDALLEGADAGDDLEYAWYRLPLARVAKAYSAVRVALGGTGPIPEGMSASAALRHEAFVSRQRAVAAVLRTAAERWTAAEGYAPPYWVLVDLARDAAAGPDVHSGRGSP